ARSSDRAAAREDARTARVASRGSLRIPGRDAAQLGEPSQALFIVGLDPEIVFEDRVGFGCPWPRSVGVAARDGDLGELLVDEAIGRAGALGLLHQRALDRPRFVQGV